MNRRNFFASAFGVCAPAALFLPTFDKFGYPKTLYVWDSNISFIYQNEPLIAVYNAGVRISPSNYKREESGHVRFTPPLYVERIGDLALCYGCQ